MKIFLILWTLISPGHVIRHEQTMLSLPACMEMAKEVRAMDSDVQKIICKVIIGNEELTYAIE